MNITQTIGQTQPFIVKDLGSNSTNSTQSLNAYESLNYTSFKQLEIDSLLFNSALYDAGLRHAPILNIYKQAIDFYGFCRIDPSPPKACLITPSIELCCETDFWGSECLGYQNKKLVYEIYKEDKENFTPNWIEISYKPDGSHINRTFLWNETALLIDEFIPTLPPQIHPLLEAATSTNVTNNSTLQEEKANWTIHSTPPLQAALIALGIVTGSYVFYKISSKVAELWSNKMAPPVTTSSFIEKPLKI